ncbi:MAG: hypothetical protein L0H29_09045, partial [Sinobacteraceae bacterium]|nr:hypothetical protein [Nevskiaceae bacterium]
VLERSQALDARLHKAEQAGTVGNFTSVTQALPSARRQAENRRLLAAHVYDGRNGLLARFMHEMGFSDAAITQRLAEFQAQGAPLTVAKWLPSAAADPYRHLWLGKIDSNTSAAVTTLSKVHDVTALADVATGLPGVKLIDPVADISTVLGAYRVRIMWLAALACGLSVLVLALYFHARRDWWLALTPAFAAVMTMAAFGLLGISANLFNLVALLLVLGLSVDYAIFTQRGRAQRHSTLLSVSLAAAATLLAFGLLSLSTTPFVRSLGLTVLVGVLIAYLLCLVLGRIEVRQWKA